MRRVYWLVALCVCQFAFAYDIADFTRDAKAHHERYLNELNGLQLDVTGTITQPGHESYSIDAKYYTRGKSWRTDATLRQTGKEEGFPITVLFDGQQIWGNLLGMKLKVSRGDVDNRVRGYLYWEQPAAGSAIAGEETVNGHPCWVITTPLRESDGTKVTMRSWYDKEHFVLVQSESTLDTKPVRMEFSDFREVRKGYVIPHAMRAVQNDVQIVNAQIVSVASGDAISNSQFDSASLDGEDFPDMAELMRTMQIFGKVFTNEVTKLLKD